VVLLTKSFYRRRVLKDNLYDLMPNTSLCFKLNSWIDVASFDSRQ